MGFFDSLLKKKPTVSERPVSKFSLDIVAPCDGRLVLQKDIPDEGFSEGHMGSGFGIEPVNGVFRAFLSGELVVVARTKHAYFIKDPGSGVTVMLHIGINTVEIDESKKAFATSRLANDMLVEGDNLCVANLDVIRSEGKQTITPILVQNDNMEGKKVVFKRKAGEFVKSGEVIISVVSA